jgi:hypothetical protein
LASHSVALAEDGRCGRDSNPRKTVLQTVALDHSATAPNPAIKRTAWLFYQKCANFETMRKVIFIFLSVVLLTGGAYLIYTGYYLKRNLSQNAVLSVNTPYVDAGVFLDGEYLGPTPFFKDDLKPGDHDLRVGEWVDRITLTRGALTAANLDLGPGVFSGSDLIWLSLSEEDTSLRVISNVDGVEVRIDGDLAGETPLKIGDVSNQEYLLELQKEGYVGRTIRVKVQNGYALNVSSQMMLNPLPETISLIDVGSAQLTLKDFSSLRKDYYEDLSTWIKGLVFYFKSHGNESEHKPDFYLSGSGEVYSSEGNLLSREEYPQLTEAGTVIAYVAQKGPEPLSQSAIATLQTIQGGVVVGDGAGSRLEILPTGTGWLRVRSGPGLGNAEVGRVNVGESVTLLEESNSWYKIRLVDNTEGWISSQFTKKL